jgi:hypothetical protein
MGRITVYVDGTPYSVLAGSEVAVLTHQLPPEQQLAVMNGLAYFTDPYGNQVGEGGGLFDGQRLTIAYFA